MTAIYDSPFLIALGWTIASSLWQAALLWLIYQVINSGGSRVSPALRHSVAVSFLFISFGWFGITFIQNYNEVAALKQSLTDIADKNISLAQALFNVTAERSAGNRIVNIINGFLPYLSAAYLIVLLVLLAKLTKAYISSIQLKTQGLIELDSQWVKFVNSYALNIGIKRKIKVFLSEKIDVPATLNFFKPIILLPVATFNHLSVAQVESVLLHELAHIRRNDYLINIIASVIETILFFNPFVHLLAQSLKKEREHCCDDLVLRYKFDPHSYASALLSLEQMRIGKQTLAIAATGQNGQLLGRVKRIMNVKNSNFNYGQKLTALVVTALILLSLAWLSPSSDKNRNNTNFVAQPVAKRAESNNNNWQTNAMPQVLADSLGEEVKVSNHIKINNDKNTGLAGAATVDSTIPDITIPAENMPPIPPSPPTVPAYPQMRGDISALNGTEFLSGQPVEFPEQYQQYNLADHDYLNSLMNNETWKNLQKDLEDASSATLQALDKNLQFIIADNGQKLKEVFVQDKKRLIVEKYLQQLLQNNVDQKEQLQRNLLAEQGLQLAKAIKAKNLSDSVRVKAIKKKAVQKAIWINNQLLQEKLDKELEKLHLNKEETIKMAYAINRNVDSICEKVNKIVAVAYTNNAKGFSFNCQSYTDNKQEGSTKSATTISVCSDKHNSSVTISL